MQRKSRSRFARFLTLPAAGLAALAGCGPSPQTPTGPSDDPLYPGVVLTVACPGDPSARVVGSYGRAWASRAGAEVRVVTYDPKAGPDAVPDADAWVIEPADLPRWADAGRLRAVPEAYTRPRTDYGWQDLLPLWTDRLLKWKGQVYALPVLGEAPLCFYRADLFADAKKHGRDLAPPATWEEFAEIAEHFPAPSLPPLPETDDALEREFYTIAASCAARAVRLQDRDKHDDPEKFSFTYDLATGKPRIAEPGFVYALKLMQRLQPRRAAADGRPAPEAFASGKAALCLADAPWIARFQKAPARPPFGVCRVPGSKVVFGYGAKEKQEPAGGNYVPYLGSGGWLGVVPEGSAHPEAAFALLADLGGDETSGKVLLEPAWGGGAFRRGHLVDTRGWTSFNLEPAQKNDLVQALQQTINHPGLSNPASPLRLPDGREHTKALAEELRAALLGKKDAAAALKAVDERWRALDAKKGEGGARADYAHSLGLLPR
jgi:multiple sugar transport system substrate-binding protein